jgi:hypothetical protein
VKVAVAVASRRVPAWQAWCVDALRAIADVTTQVVLVGGEPWQAPGGATARIAGPALAPAELALDIGDLHGADLVLDLTAGGAVADAPHGVWSFRLGDSDDAALPFAREIARGARTFEIALVRHAAGRLEMLREGRFGVTVWYPSTLRIALAEAARWPATFVAALRSGAALDAGAIGNAPPRAPLTLLERARFANVLSNRLAGELFDDLLEVVEWNVGFVDGGARKLLTGEPLDVRWLPQPDALTFIADPFVVERDGVRVLFVEAFDYDLDRGVIDALVLDDAGAVVRRERVIEAATHLSYPYPVEIDGTLYLVPENCAGNEVALYRCVEFPGTWERETALFPAFDGVDTTLFSHDGRWWAFCTRWSRGSTLALHAFWADSPRGCWTAHALNPIVVDVSSARPAGQPFVVDGALYRPGQDCSRSYGGALAIARIDVLTPAAYRETLVRRIDARRFGRWNAGIHTVSFTRDTLVVDGKHVYRDARKLGWAAKKIRRRIGRLLARPPVGGVTPA